MGKILTPDELSALLASSPDAIASRGVDPALGTVTPYNFRRPDRISKDQIRSIQLLHERFARNATTSLAAYLRTITELTVLSVEQYSYAEFLMSLPDPTAFYAIGMPPLEEVGALEMSPSVAFTIVDRRLGGSGQTETPERALTEIEQNIIDSVVKLLLDHLTEIWRGIISDVTFFIQGRETRPQMLQMTGRNEVVLVLAFDLKVADVRGLLHVCVPASVVEATGSNFLQSWHHAQREATVEERRWLIENLGRVQVSIASVLETKLRARELLALGRGDVVTLSVPTAQPIDVRVNERTKFRGHLVAHGGHAAVRVEQHTAARPYLQGEAA
jgi:flagellar motor switch protein FliM